MKSDGIILTYEELQILLFNRGYRQIEGIEMPEGIFDEEKILRIMQKMAERTDQRQGRSLFGQGGSS